MTFYHQPPRWVIQAELSWESTILVAHKHVSMYSKLIGPKLSPPPTKKATRYFQNKTFFYPIQGRGAHCAAKEIFLKLSRMPWATDLKLSTHPPFVTIATPKSRRMFLNNIFQQFSCKISPELESVLGFIKNVLNGIYCERLGLMFR